MFNVGFSVIGSSVVNPETLPIIPRKGDFVILADKRVVVVEAVEIYSSKLKVEFDAKLAVRIVKK